MYAVAGLDYSGRIPRDSILLRWFGVRYQVSQTWADASLAWQATIST